MLGYRAPTFQGKSTPPDIRAIVVTFVTCSIVLLLLAPSNPLAAQRSEGVVGVYLGKASVGFNDIWDQRRQGEGLTLGLKLGATSTGRTIPHASGRVTVFGGYDAGLATFFGVGMTHFVSESVYLDLSGGAQNTRELGEYGFDEWGVGAFGGVGVGLSDTVFLDADIGYGRSRGAGVSTFSVSFGWLSN